MNNQQKAFSYILFLLWPFGALVRGIRTFSTKTGRVLIVGAISFIGFTAFSEGDLEAYKFLYYLNRYNSLTEIINQTYSLQESKFYINLYIYIFNIFFSSHYFYFAALFATFGYLLIKVIHQFFLLGFSKKSVFELLFFVSLALYYSIRSTLSIPFYTGGLYFIYMMIKYIITENKRYLLWAGLTPLFHISLIILLPVIVLYYFLKNKLQINIAIVIFTFFLSQSSVLSFLNVIASENRGTVIQNKYENYASEKGQAYLTERYQKGEANFNWKLLLLNNVQTFLWYMYIPGGMILLYLKRKKIKDSNLLLLLFNFILLLWSVSNLMLNVSNGNRFLVFYTFVAFWLFYLVYVNYYVSKLFTWYCRLLVVLGFIYGIMNLIAFNKVITFDFFLSNYFIKAISYL